MSGRSKTGQPAIGRLALHWQILVGMLVGAGVGLALNWTCSQRTTRLLSPEASSASEAAGSVDSGQAAGEPVHVWPGPVKLPAGVREVLIRDTVDRVEFQLSGDEGEQQVVVDGRVDAGTGALRTLDELGAQRPELQALFHRYGRSTARQLGELAQAVGGLFLRLLKMVAVPLIISSLMTGVLGLGHVGRLKGMFGRTIGYYLITSLLAIVTGLVMVNLIRPGLRGALPPPTEPGGHVAAGSHAASGAGDTLGNVLYEQLLTMIPTNPFQAVAEANFLSVISFTMAFAIFGVLVGGRTAELMRELFQAGFEIMMAMTTAIIKLAPLGVLFMMLYVTATQGSAVFASLGWYVLTVTCGLAFHALIVLPLILKFVAGRRPLEFAQAMSPALLTAFSSASSNGALPLTLTSVEQRAGVSNRVSSFVLPLGATINMDGTALYEAVAVLFIAQLSGYELAISQQVLVAITALLASIGAAGIPHAGLVMMVIILQAVGLPTEMQGVILAVDRILDMARTAVNVWSDSCGCAVVARLEREAHLHAVAAAPSLPDEPT